MRILFLILISLNSFGTNYYISFSSGSDANAGTIGSPWKTVNKVNSEWATGTFNPGDSILYQKGQSWSGEEMVPAESGTSLARIIISAYGTGAKPSFDGYTTISTWTNISGNVWESTSAITSSTTLKPIMVTINGAAQRQGREPDFTDANKGYINITSHVGKTSLTATGFSNSPNNWTGARAVIRTRRYIFDTITISSHSAGGTLALSRGTLYDMEDGKGFFITNDSRTLDQQGEWYYNPSTRKLRIYTTANPSTYTIKVATLPTLLTLRDDRYLTFSGLRFEGANDNMIRIVSATTDHITFDNYELINAGSKFVQCDTAGGAQSDLTFTNGLAREALNFGFDLRNAGNNKTVTYNTIDRIAMFAGMMTNTGVSSCAIVSNSGSNHVFNYNTITNQGWTAIRANGGNNIKIVRNIIDSFCVTMDDGGALYTVETVPVTRTGIVIDSNLVLNGIGAPEGGTSGNASSVTGGIYLDDNANGVHIWWNTIFGTKSNGLFLHHAKNNDIRYNTFYDNASYGIFFQKNSPTAYKIEGNVIKFNKLIARRRNADNSQYVVGYSNYDTASATQGSLNGMGTIDSNYYARPTVDSTSTSTGRYIRIYKENGTTNALTAINYTLPEWRTLTTHDDNTKQSPLQFIGQNLDTLSRFDVNKTSSSATITIAEQYKDLEGNIYNPPSYSLPAYGSRFLMETGATPPAVLTPGKFYKRGSKIIIYKNKFPYKP